MQETSEPNASKVRRFVSTEVFSVGAAIAIITNHLHRRIHASGQEHKGEPNTMADAPSVSLTPGGICFTEAEEKGGQMRASLALTSHDSRVLIYKLKTSAPANYRVSPSTGRVLPGETRTIQGKHHIPTVRPTVAQMDRFQMEVRTVTPEEMLILQEDKEEKDEISKMWKSQSGPKALQFLLHTFTPERVGECPESAKPKSKPAKASASMGTIESRVPRSVLRENPTSELTKLREEEEQLQLRKKSIAETNKTLTHGESAHGELKAPKLAKLTPLSIPISLAVVHFIIAALLGRFFFVFVSGLPPTVDGLITMYPTGEDILSYLSSLFGGGDL